MSSEKAPFGGFFVGKVRIGCNALRGMAGLIAGSGLCQAAQASQD